MGNLFDSFWNLYWLIVSDLKVILTFLIVSTSFVMFLLPKEIKFKNLLFSVAIFFSSYILNLTISLLTIFIIFKVQLPQSVMELILSLNEIIEVFVFSMVFIKNGTRHKIIKTTILIATIMIAGVISKSIGSMADIIFNGESTITNIARALPYFSFFFMLLLIKRVDIDHYKNLSFQILIIILLTCLLLIIAGVFEYFIEMDEINMCALFVLTNSFLLLILGFSYYAAYKNVENRHAITNLEVQKTLREAEIESIEIDQNNRIELEKLRHDLKNQFNYVNLLLEKGKIDEAKKFTSEYINNYSTVLNSFSCSNNVVNSIVNLELTKAKIKNIEIDAKAIIPPLLPFKDYDLVSLITNMCDNALENYYSGNNEKIILRIFKQNDYIRFYISNPIDESVIDRNNYTQTRKVGRGHGYGTKIIKNIASTYNGYADFNIENNHFICDVLLNLEKEED